MDTKGTSLEKTEQLYDVTVVEHDKEEFANLNAISKLRQSFKRGRELEDHLFDIYSSQLQKQKEQLEHQLFLSLDTSKKKLYEEYLKNTSGIENNITSTLNEMLRENAKSLRQDLEKLFEVCDDFREKAEIHKDKNKDRYEKLMKSAQKMEEEGYDAFELRAQTLKERHNQLFTKTVELFKEKSEDTLSQ